MRSRAGQGRSAVGVAAAVAVALVLAVLLAGCAAVPETDPGDAGPLSAGRDNPSAKAAIPDLPPAEGPARPSPGCGRPSSGPAGGAAEETRTLSSGGQNREVILHVPPGLAPDRPAPLVVDLHGMGTSAAIQAGVTGWSAVADREGVIVAHPQGANNLWSFLPDEGNADIDFVADVVALVQGERCVDVSRTYASGMSMGGLLASALACRKPDLFAAFGLVSGAQWKPECEGAPPRPVVLFWGSADCVLPWFGGYGPCLAIGPPRPQPSAPVPPEDQSGFPPVEEVIGAWATHNGCAAESDLRVVSPLVSLRAFSRCPTGAEVQLYFIEGGGHTWPGSDLLQQMEQQNPNTFTKVTVMDVDATETIWAFFRAHQLIL